MAVNSAFSVSHMADGYHGLNAYRPTTWAGNGSALGNIVDRIVGVNSAQAQANNDIRNLQASLITGIGSARDDLVKDIQSNVPVFKSPVKSAVSGRGSVGSSNYVNSGSASSISEGVLAPSTIDYLNADLAKHYGMSAETAYQEALSNTAYERAVADMRRAGLNPAVIFGAGRGSSAGGVAYATPYTSDSDTVSGGSSSGSRNYSGSLKKSNNGKLFDSGVYSVLSALGGVAGAAVTKNASGFWVGTAVTQAAMSAANLLYQAKK